jgi:hypothetical protein
MLFPFSLRKVLKAGLSRCEEKDPPGILLSNGIPRSYAAHSLQSRFRDHSPLRVEVVTKLSQWGKLILVIGREKNAGREEV